MSRREVQVSETLAHLAADFLARESNRESLITVTRASLSPDLKHVTVFISVIPEKFEATALAFVKRQQKEFRAYIRAHSRLGLLPSVDFEVDYGEKNRQRIDDLTRK
ncbi:MAG: Ribosome-binding factor A [Candidatus Kaiserbacteria bacterium GW2011_GWB1_52_6]|uniref:Ribosome-binding factor A n=3 Tax=Candidatus Kaiseribacteriota TaxID=1752734 RepID=A0A0G1XJ79_9BACT|nr:MAG: Ribosome-binding factor A [Candidatus Kaiserbacteria bacterium GW2011_GWA2_52_12]KKW28173.1 MAG: Ribosome-binding factor A [Candidatus Kaiserbacteria bacterium GW2011_GWB1_52_6]KKW31016.1 MAG: Ribosome-binding factor A [Candidatus Kaiserbacteria bacterium GW2011_GWC2_52_8b]